MQDTETRESKKLTKRMMLANIPDDNGLPKKNSELRRLYKRLEGRLGKFGFNITLTLDVNPGRGVSAEQFVEMERFVLERECRILIQLLNRQIKNLPEE